MATLLYIIFSVCCVFGVVEQILLVRHGFKVDKPKKGLPNPYKTWNWRRPLSSNGEKEVKNDADFLTQYIAEQYPDQPITDVVDVYASPFRRALQSASCFAASNRLKIKIDRAAGETEKTESHAIYRPLNFASGDFEPAEDSDSGRTKDMDLSITECTDNNQASKSDGQQGPKCDIKIVETIRNCEIPNYPQDDPGTPLDIFDEEYFQQYDHPQWFGRNWKKLSDEGNCDDYSCDPVEERVAALYDKFMASESKPVIILFAHGGINNDFITYMNKPENIGSAWKLDDFRMRIKFKNGVYKSASQPTGSIIFFKKTQDQWFPDGERYSYPMNENAFDGRLQDGCSAEVEALSVQSIGKDMLYQGTEEVEEETFPIGGGFSGGKVTNWKQISKDGVTLQAGAFTFVSSTGNGKCTLHFVLDAANPKAEVTGYKGLWKPCLEAGRWIGPISKKTATGYDENNSYLTGLPIITQCDHTEVPEKHVAMGTYEVERRGFLVTVGIGCILLCVIILFTLHGRRKNGSELSIYFLPDNEVHDLTATL